MRPHLLDGDGALELVVGTPRTVEVHWNEDNSFVAAETVIETDDVRGLAVVDLSGDGRPDIVLEVEDLKRVSILLNLGERRFEEPISVVTTPPSLYQSE